jgi:hypothetical protein
LRESPKITYPTGRRGCALNAEACERQASAPPDPPKATGSSLGVRIVALVNRLLRAKKKKSRQNCIGNMDNVEDDIEYQVSLLLREFPTPNKFKTWPAATQAAWLEQRKAELRRVVLESQADRILREGGFDRDAAPGFGVANEARRRKVAVGLGKKPDHFETEG